MTMATFLRATGCALLASGLAACTVGPDFERPAAPAAKGYTAEPLSQTAPIPDPAGQRPADVQRFVAGMDIPSQWWTLFQSPALNHLVEEALAANPTVESAKAALKQSKESYSAQWAALLPTIAGELSGVRNKNPSGAISSPTSNNDPYYSLYTTQLSLTYAPDVFGGTRRAVESTLAQAETSRYQLEAVYLTLASNVVVTAITEASLTQQIATTQRLVALQHDLTTKVEAQRQLGTASQLDLLTQQAAEAAIAQTLPPLEKQLAQAKDSMATLLGRLPADAPQAVVRLDEMTLPDSLPLSLPSQLVEQRPDIRQAEETLHAATAQVGVAIAGMLPQVSLTANLGSEGLKSDQLFKSTFGLWGLGTNVTQTIFDGGALLHKRRAADAALEQAAAQYRSTVILAFQNVADSLRALQWDAESQKAAQASAAAARTAYDLARRQRDLGTISEVTLLNAEQTYQQAELALVQSRANRYSDSAGLLQALGGGWWNRPQEAEDARSGSSTR